MRITSFVAKKLHGYLDLQPSFHQDITFLTGINGSGKTSVIQAIAAILTPSLRLLQQWAFEQLSLTVEHEGKSSTIDITKDTEALLITVASDEPLRVPVPPHELLEYQAAEALDDYYEDILQRHGAHPALAYLKSLPTPMILGIDRRSLEPLELSMARRRLMRARPRPHDMFRRSLENSLRDAIALAENRFRELEVARSQNADRLREQIILSALEYHYTPQLGPLPTPSFADSLQMKARLGEAVQTLTELGISEQVVTEHLKAFFDKLAELAVTIPANADLSKTKDAKIVNALVAWMINKPQFDRVEKILRLVDKHVRDVAVIRRPIEQYRETVNGFLQDSGKSILFNQRGELCVSINNEKLQLLSGLSSGETQLVVLLSHLAFNRTVREANVIIVDEPELSLHIRWQETFVDAILKANPKLQVILATHSPSIVLDRTDHCVDLSNRGEKQ